MQNLPFYQDAFHDYLKAFKIDKEPRSLYQPIDYIINLGGKRLRPVLTLMTAELFDCDYKQALDAALSIEVFHNFSLVHDDIMDDAPLRRGKPTVHSKWDLNTGILSGDAMLIMAYQLFENYNLETFRSLATLFSKTALEVCEGQQYDIDFESRGDVSIEEYLKMIEYKTAVLVGAAMKMGAIVAGASMDNQEAIYQFGKNLGIAFQLQDDYLDAFGNPKTFGKQIGGDIIENKKTILYLRTLSTANQSDVDQLLQLYSNNKSKSDEKVKRVTDIFKSNQIDEFIKKEIQHYTDKAYNLLHSINTTEEKKDILRDLGRSLMNRKV